MDEYIQRLQLKKIPGASHWVQVDAWQEVNEAVLTFAQEVRDGTFVGDNGGGGGEGGGGEKRVEGVRGRVSRL
jgi:hypothetical protein